MFQYDLGQRVYLQENNMAELSPKKVITISGAETKMSTNGTLYTKIKDQNNLAYTFFHTKRDWSKTKALEVYETLPANWLGQTMEISYSEEQKSLPDGKPYTARTIVWFSSTMQNPPAPATKQYAAQLGLQPSSAATTSTTKSKDVDWDAIAEWKVRHAFALEAYKANKNLDNATVSVIDMWTKYVMSWKIVWLTTPTTTSFLQNVEAMAEEDEPIRVENIPF